MHRYCTSIAEEQRRNKVTKSLFAVSVLLTPLINKLLVSLSCKANESSNLRVILEWLTENGITISVSYVMTYAVLYFLVDRFFWYALLSKILRIPRISGIWEGTLRSNFGNGKEIFMRLVIKQTMTCISCTAFFIDSSSTSNMAKVCWLNKDEIQLDFTYLNKSRDLNVTQTEYHGYNWFLVRGDSMNGWYFTDRKIEDGKRTEGTMQLTKRPGKLFNNKNPSDVITNT